jgi:hypothetical protein
MSNSKSSPKKRKRDNGSSEEPSESAATLDTDTKEKSSNYIGFRMDILPIDLIIKSTDGTLFNFGQYLISGSESKRMKELIMPKSKDKNKSKETLTIGFPENMRNTNWILNCLYFTDKKEREEWMTKIIKRCTWESIFAYFDVLFNWEFYSILRQCIEVSIKLPLPWPMRNLIRLEDKYKINNLTDVIVDAWIDKMSKIENRMDITGVLVDGRFVPDIFWQRIIQKWNISAPQSFMHIGYTKIYMWYIITYYEKIDEKTSNIIIDNMAHLMNMDKNNTGYKKEILAMLNAMPPNDITYKFNLRLFEKYASL